MMLPRFLIRFLLVATCLFVVSTTAALDDDDDETTESSLEVTMAWAPCPPCDEKGEPLAAAVRYEVFVKCEGREQKLVQTVDADTTCTLKLTRDGVYRVCVVGYDDQDRASEPSDWSAPIDATPDETSPPLSTEPMLPPNRPNPFNPATVIAYSVPVGLAPGAALVLEVYDVRGQRVRRFEVDRSPGEHEVFWNGVDESGRAVGSGIYLTRFVCGDEALTRKMTLLK